MRKSDYQSFADHYTSDDIDRIKFDWNGEHGKNFLITIMILEQSSAIIL